MDIMNTDEHDSAGNHEVLLAELRGFRMEQSARFDGVEREQSDMKGWLGRLSDAVERQVQATTRLFGLEEKVASIAATASDNKLDIADLSEKVIGLEKAHAQNKLIGSGIAALIGAAVTAFATGWAEKLLHIK